MKKQPQQISNILTFVESFDSVRDASLREGPLQFRRTQSSAEFVLAFLFGEQMLVPEHVSFDNYHFLEMANAVIDARNKVVPHTKNVLRNKCPVWEPFVFSCRKLPEFEERGGGYLGLVAAQFAKTGRVKKGKKEPYFELSSMPGINKSDRRSYRRIADIGVDLDEKIAADPQHRYLSKTKSSLRASGEGAFLRAIREISRFRAELLR